MSKKESEFYKNELRDQKEHVEKYVPHYVQLGIQPIPYQGQNIISNLPQKKQKEETKQVVSEKKKTANSGNQYYAEAITPIVGRNAGIIPNVGNNIEHTWSSGMDNEIIDDVELNLDENQAMIDNNDYVDVDRFYNNVQQPIQETVQPENVNKQNNIKNIEDLNDDEYVLIISGKIIANGNLEDIQETTRQIAFGEHEYCKYNNVSINDIIVLKKIKIKIGLFLEQ